jgi:dTDP-4-dehydrorhamnose reductase
LFGFLTAVKLGWLTPLPSKVPLPVSSSDQAVSKNVSSGFFHGTNAGSCSWFEFAKYIFEIAGKNIARVTPVLSSEFATKVQRPKYSVLDNQKWSEFGIVPLGPWKDSVQKALPDMMLSLAK